ncbi:hypothetical protein FXF65_42800 [Actinomadura syzygii]|uniref:Gfo/Idh/MocA-like oxidoreductase N-terminal domain-containing protein n=1 Tax=Actinomadura syzygii TaxID=1427538 RepID=A0A5D0TMU6_9ACTN|nr:hypothetical protein FXF65_42800 [Actinomadura syzygii]
MHGGRVSAPGAAPATPVSRPVRLGLIGHGRLGAVHARHIAACPDTELAAVCDTEPAALAAAAAEHGVPVATDLDGFLAMPFDGVVIASSTQAHAGTSWPPPARARRSSWRSPSA